MYLNLHPIQQLHMIIKSMYSSPSILQHYCKTTLDYETIWFGLKVPLLRVKGPLF